MKKNTSIAVGIASAILLAIGSTLPAAADSSSTVPGGLARAKFVSRGDNFFVDDTSPDGRGAYVQYYIPGTSYSQTGRESYGCKDIRTSVAQGYVPCYRAFPERRVIYWRVYVYDADGSSSTVYGPWKRDNTSR